MTAQKGTLKILIGLYPGVVTTAAMLAEAHSLIANDIDVAAGYISSLHRLEIKELLEGIECIGTVTIIRGNKQTSELNIDAVLARCPGIVLIDDIAHGNPPGLRNRNRYQDVQEILNHGINVLATISITQVESLLPVIKDITGKESSDIVPDFILEMADSVRLIDVTGEEYITRSGDSILFSSRDNDNNTEYNKMVLTALREAALHYTASLVNRELVKYKHIAPLDTSWKTAPVYLVAISPSPYSQYLIRWTRKKAFEQRVPWLAVYIQSNSELSEEEQNLLNYNMKLVNELGAEIIVSMDDDITKGIIRVAQQHNISHIVIGKPLGYTPSGAFTTNNIIDTLIRESGEIDIFVVSEHTYRPEKKRFFARFAAWFGKGSIQEYALVTLWLVLLVAFNLFLDIFISYLSVGFIFLAAVSIISSLYRRGPVLYFASLSAVLWNFLFLQPRFTLFIDHLEDLLMFLMYFITAVIIGNLTTRLRVKEAFLRNREKNLEELYQMSKILNEAGTLDDIITRTILFLRKTLSIKTAIFLKDEDDNLSPRPHEGGDFALSGEEWSEALWCFKNQKPAGRSTRTFVAAQYYYIPLMHQSDPAGVLVIDSKGKTDFTVEQKNLLTTLVSQVSTAIERYYHHRTQHRIKLAEDSEKLYQILLNSISHELRTPITTITTSANGLLDRDLRENPEVRNIFTNDIIEASERLNRIVDNLLGSLRIESNRITLNSDWYDISELVSTVQNKLDKLMRDHLFKVEISRDIPMVKFDFNLMEQLLTNLLYNALLYTPAGSRILLTIQSKNQTIIMSVIDNGPGIHENERNRIFNKFYRSKNAKAGGLGLGLSICREIAEIHGGAVHVESNDQGGASFVVTLPLEQSEIRGAL